MTRRDKSSARIEVEALLGNFSQDSSTTQDPEGQSLVHPERRRGGRTLGTGGTGRQERRNDLLLFANDPCSGK
jgi:hypothetical protein